MRKRTYFRRYHRAWSSHYCCLAHQLTVVRQMIVAMTRWCGWWLVALNSFSVCCSSSWVHVLTSKTHRPSVLCRQIGQHSTCWLICTFLAPLCATVMARQYVWWSLQGRPWPTICVPNATWLICPPYCKFYSRNCSCADAQAQRAIGRNETLAKWPFYYASSLKSHLPLRLLLHNATFKCRRCRLHFLICITQ